MLRQWRGARRLSQLELAVEADVSARHLSYVESGKAQPSRELLLRLAEVLELPLRERNALLVAAGYASMFRESGLTTPELAQVRKAIDLILAHQEPYPAFVIDRHWEVVLANGAAPRLFRHLRGGSAHRNMLRQIFDPADMRASLVNWEEVAGDVMRHLHDQVAAMPSDPTLRALRDEVLRFPDVPARWQTRELGSVAPPVLNVVFGKGDERFRFFSTIATFGSARDVTLDELRIECFFPGDEATAAACRRLADADRAA